MDNDIGSDLRYIFTDGMRTPMAREIRSVLPMSFVDKNFDMMHSGSVECCLMPNMSYDWYRYWSTFRDSWWY